jgi:nicotinamidase-related amidase
MESLVIPNIRRLIASFRGHKMKVVFTRNGNATPGGAQLAPRLRKKVSGSSVARYRGTAGYEIDRRLLAEENELVIDKLTSGAFTQTCLDHALRNMGITGLVIAGILTDMCVLGTARTAAELGYDTLICEDACATYTERSHHEALLMHSRVFGRVADTAEVLDELERAFDAA